MKMEIKNEDGDVKEEDEDAFTYVGFAASTEGSIELHTIENWSFQTFGFSCVRTRSNRDPHNVSDNSVVVKPPIVQDSEQTS
ncbi:hypothetical protein FXO38_05179 [Capsicum annuum]|nr:hypothetical protein FXO38_05179 [Capsicum annuum]KAF3685598.1 hypothetical protein FXO37_00468 [Capsicum annuum]